MEQFLQDPLVQFLALFLVWGIAKIAVAPTRLSRLLLNIISFLALTALLFYNQLPPYMQDESKASMAVIITHGVLKTTWWGGCASLLASCVRMFLTFERKPREGRLLQDLVVALIYVTAALCIVAYVFRLPVGTVVATSGVFAIVLGLALQSTLNDVFSGIALNLGRPLTVGDWVVLDDGVQGRVIETNWRSTQLLNGSNDLVVVPNSVLAKSRITNMSGPDASHGASISVRFVPTRPLRSLLEAMDHALLSSNSILKIPAPSVSIVSLEKDAVAIELGFRVNNLDNIGRAKNELFGLVLRHAEASGVQLAPAPGTVQVQINTVDQERPQTRSSTPLRLMHSIALFASLTEEEKQDLASNMVRKTYRKGELIAESQIALTSLMIVRSGVVAVEENEGESRVELGRLAPGDFFGERGVLMGALELVNARALTAVVMYEIPKEKLAAILRERPSVAEELGALLATRAEAEHAIHGTVTTTPHSAALSARIRHFLHLGSA